MKKYVISGIAVLTVLISALTVFAQPAGRSEQQRERLEDIRQEWQNMSDHEKQKLRAEIRNRTGSRSTSPEGQLKAVQAIEEQVAKLKAALESLIESRSQYQNVPEEEKASYGKKMAEATRTRQQTINAIEQQLAKLRYGGSRQQPTQQKKQTQENQSTDPQMGIKELQVIHRLAVKEKATETAKKLESFIAKYQKEVSRTQGMYKDLRREQVEIRPMQRQQSPKPQEDR